MLWIRYAGLEAGGHNGDVAITNFSGVSNDLRLDRTDRLGSHGQMAGRDYITKRVWTMTLTTLADDENGAVALASQWERAVLNDDVLLSNRLVPFEYSRDRSIWYRVYGRPSDYAGPDLGDYTREGAGQITLQFEQLDPWHYSSDEGRTRIGVVAQRLGTGFRAPLRAPVRSTLVGGEPRAGVVRSEGEQPAPVRVVFHGPCSDPRVWGGGFEAGYRGRLAHDETVVLDGKNKTVTLRTPDFPTRHVPGLVTRRTRIANLSVPPGVTNLWFDAQDPTGTSFVDVFWSDAFASMQ